jgi:uncharacterized short protein YbdD (DUF466 family)
MPADAEGGRLWARIRRWLAAVPGGARRVAGMPDYAAYLDHLRRCHPGQPLPSEKEYFELYTRSRYGDGPTRCC